MHGQWDWMNDPRIHSSTWDWDNASTAEAWKHSHNYVHHTFTNIRGKDKDLGYEIMRIDPHQRWHPVYLLQPAYNLLLAGLFEWGVAVHDLDFEAIRSGQKSMRQVREELRGIAGKARDQVVKDYIAWPLMSALASAAVGAAERGDEAGTEALAPPRPQAQPRRPDRPPGARRRRRGLQARRPRQRRRQRGPQLLVLRDHLLRPLPRPDLHLLPCRSRGRGPRRLVHPPAHRRREHRGLARSSTSPAATSATRSSTTSSPTCRAPATRRSRRR